MIIGSWYLYIWTLSWHGWESVRLWKENLSRVSAKYFAITASCVSVEQIFSVGVKYLDLTIAEWRTVHLKLLWTLNAIMTKCEFKPMYIPSDFQLLVSFMIIHNMVNIVIVLFAMSVICKCTYINKVKNKLRM